MARGNSLLDSRRVLFIRIADIAPNPHQPRTIFAADGLRELAESIRLYGVLQPLSVRRTEFGKYELVAGERRLRASRMAGLTEVPCILLEAGEKESSLIALVENLQRCDLDFFEEAEGLQRLIRKFGLSQEEAARRVGKSQSAVANKLRLLRLSPETAVLIRQNGLTERHARALLRLESDADRIRAVEHIVRHHLNVAQTEEYIEKQLPVPVEEPVREKIHTLYVFKDIRLFLNTVSRAIETMRRSGVPARMDKREEEDGLSLVIKIPGKTRE